MTKREAELDAENTELRKERRQFLGFRTDSLMALANLELRIQSVLPATTNPTQRLVFREWLAVAKRVGQLAMGEAWGPPMALEALEAVLAAVDKPGAFDPEGEAERMVRNAIAKARGE